MTPKQVLARRKSITGEPGQHDFYLRTPGAKRAEERKLVYVGRGVKSGKTWTLIRGGFNTLDDVGQALATVQGVQRQGAKGKGEQ